jgi:hypothetical protein
MRRIEIPMIKEFFYGPVNALSVSYGIGFAAGSPTERDQRK